MKKLLKKVIYYSGMLSLYHKFRNRDALTVVLFHRVLPISDVRWLTADKEWTVSCTFFESCLEFFLKHYNPITLKQLIDFVDTRQSLPPRPLLITFDDGWSDSEEFVLGLVRKKQIKPILFVTLSAINAHVLSWESALYSIWKGGLLSDAKINELTEQFELTQVIGKADWKAESSIRTLIKELSNVDQSRLEHVKQIIYKIAYQLPGGNQMLSREQLEKISETMDLGAHGVRHISLTESPWPLKDLIDSREQLEKLVTLPYHINTMSLPNGRYDKELLALAEKGGYKLVFGGQYTLNRLSACADRCFMTRLNIVQYNLSDSNGCLQRELLAFYLFRARHVNPPLLNELRTQT